MGSKIEAVAEIVAESSIPSRRVEPPESGPSHQEKVKAAARIVLFARKVDEKEDESDNNEDDHCIDSGDDCVSHSLYRDIIAEGFDKRFPSRLASNKLTYFPIDDSVTRTLAASRYSAKAF